MRYDINAPKVIHQVFESEVVIVNLDNGTYYSIRGSGTDIWRNIDTGASREAITSMYIEESAPASVGAFLDQLVAEELILPSTKPGGSIAYQTDAGTFQAPQLDKFTDMQDLLLLDPIHELDESGWPSDKPAAPPRA